MKESWSLTRELFEGPGASRSLRTHGMAGVAEAWAAVPVACLGICLAPSDLAVNAVSGGRNRAQDRSQRALENYLRGFRRSEIAFRNSRPAHPRGGREAWGSSTVARLGWRRLLGRTWRWGIVTAGHRVPQARQLPMVRQLPPPALGTWEAPWGETVAALAGGLLA